MAQSLERGILAEVKKTLCNSKIRMKDLLEWSSGTIKAQEGEILIQVHAYDMTWNCCVPADLDKRPKA